MMKMHITFLLLLKLIMLVTPKALRAGNEVGNGGDVVVCEKGPKKLELLDLYEARDILGYQIKDESDDYKTILERHLNILKGLDPKMYGYLKRELSLFIKKVKFVKDSELVDIKDSLHLTLPKSCKLQQIAIRPTGKYSLTWRYLINEEVWNDLPPLSRAGLVLHEIVYSYFRKLGQQDSRSTRAYVGWFLSQRLQTTNKKTYWNFIRNMKVAHYH